MPSNTAIRLRIIKHLTDKPKSKYRDTLRLFHVSARKQVEGIISQMIGDSFLVKLGDGARGSPIQLYHGLKWVKLDVCPLCNGSGTGYRELG